MQTDWIAIVGLIFIDILIVKKLPLKRKNIKGGFYNE